MFYKKVTGSMTTTPVMPVKDSSIFPHLFIPLNVGRDFSKDAVKKAISDNNSVIITVLQKNPKDEVIKSKDDLYDIGVLCKIIKYEQIPNSDTYKVLLNGIQRVRLINPIIEKHIESTYEVLLNPVFDLGNEQNKALYDLLIKDLTNIVGRGFVSETIVPIKELENPIAACYLLLSMIQKAPENQETLYENDPFKIVEYTYQKIQKQKKYMDIKEAILNKAKESMTESQKEYFLKEQIKVIKKELGEDKDSEVEGYEKKLEEIKPYMTEPAYEEVKKNIKKLQTSFGESMDAGVTKNYLDCIFDLPWSKKTEDKLDIDKAKEILDSEHYDLVDVKERILEFLAVKKLNTQSKGPIICFSGPPGVGKSTVAKSIAKAIGRECVSMSLGGVRDEAEVKGHRRTYLGSMPGKIIQAMKQVKVLNPVIILDEIDKLSSDFRGDPSSALLEVLDPAQNHSFKDHYVNLDYNLSNVMFIATANRIDTIPPALRDRLEIINIAGYCEEEKIEIAKRFLVKKNKSECGLKSNDVIFNNSILKKIIRSYTMEFGVRELSRRISKICRKVAKRKAQDLLKDKIVLTENNLKEFLDVEIYSSQNDNKNGIGYVTGLAWTPYGGEILKLEATLLNEVGPPILTGSLGEVMKESASIAVSLIKKNAEKFGISEKIFQDKKIHIHAPSGGVPKDGPSAGIALLSSLVSIAANKKVKNSLAMTGEVTLTGRVLAVGGIKEKVLAAIRSGIKTVILPKDNKKDFDTIPDHQRKKIVPIYVENIEEVIANIF